MIRRFATGRLARGAVLCAALSSGAVLIAATTLSRADEEAEVKIDNFTFSPVPVRLKQGEQVTWVNRDDIPHSIVVTGLPVRSHPLDTDGTFAYRFERAGVYNYVCGLHPFMKGQVVVTR
jgi:plastocyanin